MVTGFLNGSRARIAVVVLLLLAAAGAGAAYLLGRPDSTPAPATKQAIAAVAVDVLDIEPSSYEPNPSFDVPEPLGVRIRWHPGGARDAHSLRVGIEPAAEQRDQCGRYYSGCDEWEADGGTVHLAWQEEQPEEDPGILVLTFATGGEHRSVVYAGESLVGDPRDQSDLPVSVEQLEELVTDDRFASTTTREMVETDLAKWPDDAEDGDPVPTTPGAVAQWMFQDGVRRPGSGSGAADTDRYGDNAVGAVFRSRNRTTSVVLVPRDSPKAPKCGRGWHCRTAHGVTTGWRPGVAITLRESRDAVVLGTVRSDAITDGLPRPAWRFGSVGRDFYALQHSYAQYGLETTRLFARGDGPPWFGR